MKVKSYMMAPSMPSAWLVNPKDKGRKKIYLGNTIYLNNNSEFMIELFNPLKDSILAELKINGKLVSQTGLVLRPGERFYLDCFIDDLKKFIYKTYEVDVSSAEVQKAIENNGDIEISFFKERVFNTPGTQGSLGIQGTSGLQGSLGIQGTSGLQGFQGLGGVYMTTNTLGFSTQIDNMSMYASLSTEPPKKSLKKLEETGRIEKGKISNQKFESIDMQFEYYSFKTISYKLLPESKRPKTKEDIKKLEMHFCGSCGNKKSDMNDRFCRNCGHRF